MKNLHSKVLLKTCIDNKKSLTPTRALIIETLSKHNKPASAYELLAEINKKGSNKLNISTIYRVLEFWIALGLVHKVASINKFLLCDKPHEKHVHILNFCTKCEKVIESCNKTVELKIKDSISKHDLVINKKYTLEIPVLCSSCN